MMKRSCFLALCFVFLSQVSLAENACGKFDTDDAKTALNILAHPALGGRGTGQPGFDVAGLFLARELKNAGFLPLPNNNEGYFQTFPTNYYRVYSRNVIGYLPGETDEFVIIGAHYDHLGTFKGGFYPGADDNASGTTAVLEIVRTLGECARSGKKFHRGIVVGFWGAEELGLIGSRNFARLYLLPFNKRVAYLNLDMIGRNDSFSLTAIGAEPNTKFKELNPDLFKLLVEENQKLNLPFVLMSEEGFFDRTDSASFFDADPSGRRLPVMFFSTFLHSDYHKPTDTPDKIDFDKLIRVTDLTYSILLRLADSDLRPVYVSPKSK